MSGRTRSMHEALAAVLRIRTHEVEKAVLENRDTLTPQQWDIISRFYGIGRRRETLVDIAREYGFNRQWMIVLRKRGERILLTTISDRNEHLLDNLEECTIYQFFTPTRAHSVGLENANLNRILGLLNKAYKNSLQGHEGDAVASMAWLTHKTESEIRSIHYMSGSGVDFLNAMLQPAGLSFKAPF